MGEGTHDDLGERRVTLEESRERVRSPIECVCRCVVETIHKYRQSSSHLLPDATHKAKMGILVNLADPFAISNELL